MTEGASGADLAAYVPGDRRQALAEGRALADRVHGAVLFADLAGFTALTESLARHYGPRRGAEQLSAALETVFAALLADLARFGGAAIYFSGDALTCWFDADDGARALAAAQAMHASLEQVGTVRLTADDAVQLGMKVAIAVGAARRFVAGDPDVQLIDVLAGALLDELADAEGAAVHGETLLAASAVAALGARVVLGEPRSTALGRPVRVAGPLRVEVPPPSGVDFARELPVDVARQWVLPAVWERLSGGGGDFLTELRVTTPMFLRFGGLDFDGDDDAPARLDEFVTAAQHVVDGYGGNVLQLTLGDKGAYLYAVFGAPVAHEDDAARACAAALELLGLERSTAATGVTIGLSRGPTRSGTYGHGRRRTFCCLGDPVNLAARLMGKAGPGQVFVSPEVREVAGAAFDWRAMPPLPLKGKAEPVAASQLLAASGAGRARDAALPFVGRDDVLATIRDRAGEALAGRGQVLGVSGAAGLGKSRVLAEALRQLPAGTAVAVGEGQALGVRTAYWAWRAVLAGLFGVVEPDPAAAAERIAAAVTDLDAELSPRAPLLATVTGTPVIDSEVTAGLDAKVRKESLELLIVQVLTRLTRRDGPLVLVLDDAQWLDPLSQDLLDVVVHGVAPLPVLVLLGYRPPDTAAPAWLQTVRTMPYGSELALAELEGGLADRLVDGAVAHHFGQPLALPDAARTLLAERTQGNPFHVDQLVAYLRLRGIDPTDPAALARAELPDSLQTIVLSRIDALAESPRRTARVGSVVGRRFATRQLLDASASLGPEERLRDALDQLAARELVLPDPAADDPDGVAFRHAIVREVAYESIPFALRAALHESIGLHLERRRGDGQALPLDLLAHHFWFGEDDERKRRYLRLAGDAARDDYANDTAVEHYERLLSLPDADPDGAVRYHLGQVHELGGRWDSARECYELARAAARGSGDERAATWRLTALAEIARKQGDFAVAAERLAAAADSFTALGDDAGLGRVLHLQGTLAGQQQQIARARERYEASMIIRRRLGDRHAESGLLANLGIMAEYEGDYRTAIGLTEQALALRIEIGDRWAVGHAYSNLGQLLLYVDEVPRALDALTEALRLHREVGDPWMIAIDYDNLGSARLRGADVAGAADAYATCVEVHRLLDDPWSAAHLLEDIAALGLQGIDEPGGGHAAVALRLLGAADAHRAAIGSPRTPAQQAEQDERFAPASARLGPVADHARDAGRRMPASEALDAAGELCRTVRDRT